VRIEHRHDRRVPQPLEDPDLPGEPAGPEDAGDLPSQDLHRNRAALAQILRQVDRRHAPAAELALDAVALLQDTRQSVICSHTMTPSGSY
jgi:hypothetical protein